MLIKPEDINKVLELSEDRVITRGKKYFEKSKVTPIKLNYTDDNNFEILSHVDGTYIYNVLISKKDSKLDYYCNCPAFKNSGVCKHVIATMFSIYVDSDKYLFFKNISKIKEDEKRLFTNVESKIEDTYVEKNKLVKYFEDMETKSSNNGLNINLIPVIRVDEWYNDKLLLYFKIGKDKMYKLKDIGQFSYEVEKGNSYKYGKTLEFEHKINNFNPNSRELVKFVVKKYNEYHTYTTLGNYYFNIQGQYKSYFPLKYAALDEFFEMYKNKEVVAEIDFIENNFGLVKLVEEEPKLEFEVVQRKNGIELLIKTKNFEIYEGQEYVYVLKDNKLCRCSKEFKDYIYPIIKERKRLFKEELSIPSESCPGFFEYVYPKLNKIAKVDVSEKTKQKYTPENLVIKTYLDMDENLNIVCDVRYKYGEIEINPFDTNEKINVNRNILKERKATKIFNDCHFLLDSKKAKLYIMEEEYIYSFLNEGIDKFKEHFEVYVTDNLKKREIVKPKNVTMGVRVENDLLNINFSNLNFSESELKEILKAYRLKKKFYRLKKGNFVEIDNDTFFNLANLVDSLNITNLSAKDIKLPKYRAMYLEKLASENKLELNKDKEFDKIINDITNSKDLDFKIPKEFNGTLRDYQKIGFNWLKVLDKYNFGGILADEMGLGKTIQVIALLISEKKKSNMSSIVVCPSSLYLNWKKEINKFAQSLNVLVINGNKNEREQKIKEINKYDVVVTSYDMLKRDIESYKNIKFRFVIADEAQYIKNNNTKNSKALKKLDGKTKFALTGTPIENSLAELWSIFDFCMPGYLYSYTKFKENYESLIVKDENKEITNKLRAQVKPFILRRIKKEVLKELPSKTETVMYSDMEKEQRKIYEAYLLQAQEEMKNIVNDANFEKNKLQVLALITRLRQICCHPSLFISNYTGTSSKLNQCIDLVNDAISSGHKVLLFSQFTSMIDILKKELNKNDIKYMELTGKTKADKRLEMVNKFNKENEIKVFLISLKAGGTGLNLVGADIVIHFDPWWNLSVQNQATDRAHRIGQKNKVQVYKLITENSIEEKIQKLQERKKNLAEDIVKSGENFITKMSKEELMGLFD